MIQMKLFKNHKNIIRKKLIYEPPEFIVKDVLEYLTDKVIIQNYFPTYEQMWYETKESVDISESQYKRAVEWLRTTNLIIPFQGANNIEKFYPQPCTISLDKKVTKIMLE